MPSTSYAARAAEVLAIIDTTRKLSVYSAGATVTATNIGGAVLIDTAPRDESITARRHAVLLMDAVAIKLATRYGLQFERTDDRSARVVTLTPVSVRRTDDAVIVSWGGVEFQGVNMAEMLADLDRIAVQLHDLIGETLPPLPAGATLCPQCGSGLRVVTNGADDESEVVGWSADGQTIVHGYAMTADTTSGPTFASLVCNGPQGHEFQPPAGGFTEEGDEDEGGQYWIVVDASGNPLDDERYDDHEAAEISAEDYQAAGFAASPALVNL